MVTYVLSVSVVVLLVIIVSILVTLLRLGRRQDRLWREIQALKVKNEDLVELLEILSAGLY